MGGSVREDAASKKTSNRRVLWLARGGAAVVAATVVLGVTLSTSMHPATGRGEPLQALPSASPRAVAADAVRAGDAKPAATVEEVWSGARSSVEAKGLTRSTCLDETAQAYAAAAAKMGGTGASPEVPTTECGGKVQFGYILGFDSTGLSQAAAALSATPKGESPLVSDAARNVGYALVASKGSSGHVNGYVLAWAVSK